MFFLLKKKKKKKKTYFFLNKIDPFILENNMYIKISIYKIFQIIRYLIKLSLKK